jgi:hypothetical protein
VLVSIPILVFGVRPLPMLAAGSNPLVTWKALGPLGRVRQRRHLGTHGRSDRSIGFVTWVPVVSGLLGSAAYYGVVWTESETIMG